MSQNIWICACVSFLLNFLFCFCPLDDLYAQEKLGDSASKIQVTSDGDAGSLTKAQSLAQTFLNEENPAGAQPGAGQFNVWNLVCGLIFSSIGFVAFVYGKKMGSLKPLLIGLAMLIYPYFISNAILTCAIGIFLCILLFILRD